MQTINHIHQVIPAHILQVPVPEKKMVRTIVIEQDDDPISPRTWDNLGTMYCWHRNYKLGDKQPSKDDREFMLELIHEFNEVEATRLENASDNYTYPTTREEWRDYDNWYMGRLTELFDRYYVSLPLYLFDHSGITMNCGGFSCSWDSGQVGFIAVSKEKLRKEYGWKRITQDRIKQVYKYLTGEVETYAQYLEGQVYGFTIYEHALGEDPVDGQIEESCWGFFGHPDTYKTNGMTDHWPEDWETTCGVAIKYPGASYDWEIAHQEAA